MSRCPPKRASRTKALRQLVAYLGVGLLLLFLSCAQPEPTDVPPQTRSLHLVWQRANKTYIRPSQQLATLAKSDFPIVLSMAAMDPTQALPHPNKTSPKATHLEISRDKLSQWLKDNESLSLPRLPKEGAITLRTQSGKMLDWITWAHFPKDATLLRTSKMDAFCQGALHPLPADGPLPCKEQHRGKDPILKRLRHIRSAKEFAQLTRRYGDMGLQVEVVKFVVDKQHDDLPHFFSASEWSLHFTFVWEVLRQQRRLDTCVGEDYKIWWREYQRFFEQHFGKNKERDYIMGSVIFYPGAGLYAVEFATGYNTPGKDMVLGYRRLRQMFDPRIDLRIRAKSEQQLKLIQDAAGDQKIPTWLQDAPYQGERIQLLSPGVAYGTLKALTNQQLATTPLGLQVIALLKDVPNDINFVGGILSAQFQSPLSHINVLSRNRGTPHLVLKDALARDEIKALLNKLVRLEVTSQGYRIEAADRQEAEAFWQRQRGKRQPFTPKRDLTRIQFVDVLAPSVDHKASAYIGAKAANLAEMAKVNIIPANATTAKAECKALTETFGKVPVPKRPFAIPFYWYVDHIKRAGINEAIQAEHKAEKIRKDPTYRRQLLDNWQKRILETDVNPKLLTALKKQVKARYGNVKVRFRSSTNVEDLPDFNGAGLYTSKSGQLEHETKTIERALRTVWASIWSERAWSERDFYRVDHKQVAMGILVHPSFPDEDANGVVVSSNPFYASGSTFDTYIAVQQGEHSIVNPAGNDTPEQFLLRWSTPLQFLFLSRSNLATEPILTRKESIVLGCYMRAIHEHFKPIAAIGQKPFAMEAEFKITPPNRTLIIKQTRPYIFGEEQQRRPSCQ